LPEKGTTAVAVRCRRRVSNGFDFCGPVRPASPWAPPPRTLAGRVDQKTGGSRDRAGVFQIGRGGDDDVLPEVRRDAPAAGRLHH